MSDYLPYAGTGTVFDHNEETSTESRKNTGVHWEVDRFEIPPAHQRRNDLDPRVHGPFLDEIHLEEMIVALEVANERRDEE